MSFIVNGKYEANIGLEIHCQILSSAKIFSASPAAFGAEPNSNVSFFDAGFPGMLPTVNRACVEQAIRTGLGLNAAINKTSVFARKHYLYADLPAGYQISQWDMPIVSDGFVEITLEDGQAKRIRVERMHIEQDAGKLVHDRDPAASLVDFNRAGVGLMEIVSKPDMTSPYEAGQYLAKIRALVRWLGTCDGNMDQGSMRCDVNLSLRPIGSDKLGVRTETKNVNSVRFAMQAIEFEAKRQADLLDSGAAVVQETRLFDSAAGATRGMRAKENAIDYRFFPDPDIPPLVLEDGLVERIRLSMPEMPDDMKRRFMDKLGLSPYDAEHIVSSRESAAYFEEAFAACGDAKAAANWMLGDLAALLNEDGIEIADSPVPAADLADLVVLVKSGDISGKQAKEALAAAYRERKSPRQIVSELGMRQVSDRSIIEGFAERVLAANPANVAAYRAGKTGLLGFFVGQVIKETKGQGNPSAISKILIEKLG
ncbi:MAG: Asp-tRNA(Asn)/Glu-tRNA(Gln) amidotransferase subunit GatB [Rickettsiales bacterium]|jgi:aspartyl-tRNA(Asn)/glutamyl-tRNA(Gln) amidotransferase subunit B|nr:Asp-tRNA(Asn)/Glu-tRNA(Gln) amidotransferase subunit GatB [Rickettsiales bacterium]